MIQQLKKISNNWLVILASLIVILIAIISIFAPWLAPFDPAKQFFEGLTIDGESNCSMQTISIRYGPPWSRPDCHRLMVMVHTGTSLLIGIVANGIAGTYTGSFLGILAGYAGGLTATIINRFTDLMMAFPALLLAIALAAIFSPGLWIVALVIALVNWVWVARVIYSQNCYFTRKSVVSKLLDRLELAGLASSSYTSFRTSSLPCLSGQH